MQEYIHDQNTGNFYPPPKQNNNLIIALLVLSTVLIIALVILITVWLDEPKEEPDPSNETTATTVYVEPTQEPEPSVVPTIAPTPQPTSTPLPVYYYIRKSAYDTASQIGAFNNYDNAVAYANKYASNGYEVYDAYGNMLHDPVPDSVSASSPTMSNGVMYRVRKSPYDEASQIGAFKEFENAKNQADTHKSQGYEVYDLNGNLIYTP